jgi:hypothetical protein
MHNWEPIYSNQQDLCGFPYPRRGFCASLSKEDLLIGGFILSVALFLNKNPNVNGALFPNFVPENIFS